MLIHHLCPSFSLKGGSINVMEYEEIQVKHMKKVLLIVGLFLTFPIYADFEGAVTATSDYRIYGVSQTLEDPALQLDLSYSHESGFFFGTFISNVDFVEDSDPNDLDASVEIDLFVGYEFDLGKESAVALSLITYEYPGTNVNLDYLELILDYSTAFGNFTVGYSNDAFALDETGIRYEYAYGFDLSENASLGFQIGYYDLDNGLNDSYVYYDLGVTVPVKMIDVTLSYNGTTSSGEDLFGDAAEDKFVLSATYSF